jgi:hypothetical protein
MRRFRFGLVLPLLLLFAQHGAVLHDLSHLSYAAYTGGAELKHNEQLLENRLCLACYSFAQVTSPAAGALWGLDRPDAPVLKIPAPSRPLVGADTPTPRSRGPPHFQA